MKPVIVACVEWMNGRESRRQRELVHGEETEVRVGECGQCGRCLRVYLSSLSECECEMRFFESESRVKYEDGLLHDLEAPVPAVSPIAVLRVFPHVRTSDTGHRPRAHVAGDA